VSTPEVVWIRSPEALAALGRQLAGTEALALDTEADSLHHYPERLCLVQLADAGGHVYLVDPLALSDLEPLRPVCADPATLKVFHSAENDLGHLKRRFGFTFTHLADTALAARLLGIRELGLDALIERCLGVKPPKSQQKTDWARRPLSPAQEAYAAEDVRHLVALNDRLTAELRTLGRESWFREECEALAAAPPPSERAVDSDAYRRLRGASRLDSRGLAVLHALFAQREAWAVAERRPPFKVLNPETLVALAAARPQTRGALMGIPGLPPRLVERYGDGVIDAVNRGLAERLVPAPRRSHPRPVASPVVQKRGDALKRWRATAAERTGLDPGVLLPQRLIDVLAAEPPRDAAALRVVPGFRRWRTEAFGSEVLAALAAAEPARRS
jgi:ribonuclease D